MSRSMRHDWFQSLLPSIGRLAKPGRAAKTPFRYRRRLRIEPLEDRRLLANVTVSNASDVVNGTTTSIPDLIANPGGDGISLREAVRAANNGFGDDVVTFAAELSGTTILVNTEIEITSGDLTIDATSLANNVTIINVVQQSRLFKITAAEGDFLLGGLTLTGGRTDGYGASGGAVYSASLGELELVRCVITGNGATGQFSYGGGVFSTGDLTLVQTMVEGNFTDGLGARGGGIRGGRHGVFGVGGKVTLVESSVIGNRTEGEHSQGGGIHAQDDVTLVNSVVSGNRTWGYWGRGGGIDSEGDVILTDSTVSDNWTEGERAVGGGIYANDSVTLTRSTVSGNRTEGDDAEGGGILSRGAVVVNQSTVGGNRTLGNNAGGGGIYSRNNSVLLNQSVVSDNSTSGRFSNGGGISSFSVVLNQSVVSGNRTLGNDAKGGGIYANRSYLFNPSDIAVQLNQSVVSGNSTAGTNSHGGGIWSNSSIELIESSLRQNSTSGYRSYGGGMSATKVTLTDSTVHGNFTTGNKSYGGGIAGRGNSQPVTLTRSTVSGNSTTGNLAHGGGLYVRGDNSPVTLNQSTITDNHAFHFTARGGGLFQNSLAPIVINGTILSANTAGGGGSDLVKSLSSTLTVNYSLIGTGVAPNAGGNNVATDDPKLGALTYNGGPTLPDGAKLRTHALLAGSPASDAGDPSIAAVPNQFDQRRAPFSRVFGGRIDIGAYERQTLPAHFFVVTTTADEFDYSNAAVSLREAVNSANGSAGTDTITFAPGLSGLTITLGGTDLEIVEAVTIDGTSLTAGITINANQQSRIFNFTAAVGDFTLAGLTLTGGRTTGSNTLPDTTYSGGAIRSLTLGRLTLDRTTVSGNSTAGNRARGGGVFAVGNVSVLQSTVSGNNTAGVGAHGGGIFSHGSVSVNASTISGNSTTGDSSYGGGFYASDRAVLSSAASVSGNSTTANNSRGGGFWAYGNIFVYQSTVSGNSTTGSFARGGGIYAAGPLALTNIDNSTVSGNTTAGSGGINGPRAEGGGIAARGDVWLYQSTLSGNRTTGANSHGGGIWSSGGVNFGVAITQSTVTGNQATTAMGGGVFQADTAANHAFSIDGSIVSANTASGGGPDLVKDSGSTLAVNYSLIGTGVAPNTGTNNVVNNNPLLSPLANNGGPTQTHALLVGSPAIDKGDPSIGFNPALFDQRGAPFVRVFNGDAVPGARIDIGAHEQQPYPPMSFVVDIVNDENDGNHLPGDLSLREAIGLANASPGADFISFAQSLSGATIVLGGTALPITGSLTIDAGALADGLTIDANQASRVIDSTGGGETDNVTLAGLTLTRGRTTAGGFESQGGGAIRALSVQLNLIDSTVTGNSITGNSAAGGGIWASGTVTLLRSTVNGNSTTGSSSSGGGIRATTAILTDSTLSGNSTAGNNSLGGGMIASAVTLLRSTVSGNSTAGNSAHGAGIFATGSVTIDQSTVTNNHAALASGGGLFQDTFLDAPILVNGSIVAGNTAVFGGADLVKDAVSTLAVNYSLIGTDVAPTAGGNNIVTNNPQLSPLANNGGPTKTHALVGGSPAINAGNLANNSSTDFDQRGAGFPRVEFGRIDIGSYEFFVTGLPGQGLVVDTIGDVFNGNFTPGNLSLREAVLLANGNFGPDVITFAAGFTSGGPATIGLTQGELAIRDSLTIVGPGANLLTIDQDATNSRVLNVDDGNFTADRNIAISGLTLTGGNLTAFGASGGGIRSFENLTLSGSVITGNTTTGTDSAGGGLWQYGGNLTIAESTFSGNTARRGGGIFVAEATSTIDRSTINNNTATGGVQISGGGIAKSSGSLTITASTVSGNIANDQGGGINNFLGTLIVRHSTIAGNRNDADGSNFGQGGGIFTNSGVTLDHTIVAGNFRGIGTTRDDVYNEGGQLSASYSLIELAPLGIVGVGNLTGVDPLLGPLANNGGPTQTRALLSSSPAINLGDPAALPGVGSVPQFDQRGADFDRVRGVRIDVGAFELQVGPPPLLGDYNRDNRVDAIDYVLWRNSLGGNAAAYSAADGDGDGTVDQDDYGVWRANFGKMLPPSSGTLAEVAVYETQKLVLPEPSGETFRYESTALSSSAVLRDVNSGPLTVAPMFVNSRPAPLKQLKLAQPRSFVNRLDLLLLNHRTDADTSADRAMNEFIGLAPNSSSINRTPAATDEAFSLVGCGLWEPQ